MLAAAAIVLLLAGCGHAIGMSDANNAGVARGKPVSRIQAKGRIHLPSGRTYELTGDLALGPARPLFIVLGGLHLTSAQTQQATHITGASGLPSTPAPASATPFDDPVNDPDAQGYGSRHGITVAYGDGLGESWDAGECCGYAAAHHLDDLQYLADVVHDVSDRLPVDPRRVYLIGFSNGGMLAERAACDRPDLFAAAASVAGPLLTNCPYTTRILHVAGLADTTVHVNGGYSPRFHFTFPSINEVRDRVLHGHPDAVFDLVTIPHLGHEWPTAAANHFGTSNIATWLLRQSRPATAD
jgi:predicted esterase